LAETRRFEIMRNGEPIGTHVIEVNRSGNEFFVSVVTDLTVKVLFVTAYRLQIAANERWANGRLLALNSTSNNNGTRHVVSAAARGYSQDVWYNDQARLVQAQLVTRDGSVIVYRLL
jgi:hypothetical protein